MSFFSVVLHKVGSLTVITWGEGNPLHIFGHVASFCMRQKVITIHRRKHHIKKLKAVYPDLRAPILDKEAEDCTLLSTHEKIRSTNQTPLDPEQKLSPNHKAHLIPNFASSSFAKERSVISSKWRHWNNGPISDCGSLCKKPEETVKEILTYLKS